MLALVLAWTLAAPARAQDATVVVEVLVTAVAGDDVYVDAGRLAGLETGDLVTFQPPGGPTVRAFVRAVSRSSSRAELEGGGTISVGERGEVRIPKARLVPEPDGDAAGEREEPAWEAPTVPWDTERPLLAPAAAREAAERQTTLHGRLSTAIDQTWDEERDQRFLLLRQGLGAEVVNPFRRGGALNLDVEAFRREAELVGPDEADDRVRLDRLSYSVGGTRERPLRAEVGRFLHHEFPELGVLDGADVALRTGAGSRWGASAGFLPDPRSDFRTGDDSQVSAYYRTPRAAPGAAGVPELEWGVAWQNTWHRGDKDRSLLVGDVDWHPTERLSFSGGALVDHYGHGDTIKSSGLELTELDLRGRYRFDARAGVGTYFTHRRWPELLRPDFANLTPDQIRGDRLRRTGLDAWTMLSDAFRVSARGDLWSDEDDDGSSASARVTARDWLYDDGQVSLDAFASEGEFSRYDGVRLSADRRFASSLAGVSWEHSRSRQEGFLGVQSELVTERVRVHLDTTLAAWSLSTYLETRFGDEQEALVAGLFLQYRF
jgi:hypothetical protein